MGRVLAIGLDSVDEVDLKARLAAGTMPHLAALAARGTWSSLAVDPLCRSEHPWRSFVTGLDPQRHGGWSHIRFDPATYTDAITSAEGRRPFWEVGDQAVVVVLDVPGAPPVRRLRGVHIVDWAAHEPEHARASVPAAALAALDARFGENPAVGLEYTGTWNDVAWLKAYGAAVVDSARLRADVMAHLLETAPGWQLGLVVFGEAHQLAHHALHGGDLGSILHGAPTAATGRAVLDDVHRALDDAVGRLVDALGPDDVVVVFSPKGNEAVCDLPSNVLVPELLHRKAFGAPLLHQPSVDRWERRGRPPVVLPGGMSYVGAMRAAFGGHPWRRVRHAGRRAAFALADAVAPGPVGRLRVAHRRRHARPPSLPPVARPYDDWYVATWYRPWWPRMAAFVIPSFSDLHVRLNVVGRERDGVVPADGYRRAADEVEVTLRACTSPRTGRSLVASVQRPRGDDPFTEVGVAADLVVSWAEDTDVLEHPEVGVVGPYPAWRVGGHGARGFALVAGGGIARGRRQGDRIVDLSASLLALAGLEARAPIDGTPFALEPLARAGG